MKILMATGGTGGHIIPTLVTARELRKRGHEIIFAGVFRTRQASDRLQAEGFSYHEISAKGFTVRSLGSFVSFLVSCFRSFFESFRILRDVRPDVVAGFGGYGSFWIVFAACLRGVPTLIQEQNVRPGKANLGLSFFVKKIAVGFESAKTKLPSGKTVLTGCPLRPIVTDYDRSKILAEMNLPQQGPVLLVLGGSQGSQRINEEMIRAVGFLKNKISFSLIHICGQADVEKCKSAYQNTGIPHYVIGFTDAIDKAYTIADLVVSRSGAMTVTELAAFYLPAILIPYPHAGAHQRDNAMVLALTKHSLIIEENDLNESILGETIARMLTNKPSKDEIISAYRGIYRSDAAARLSEEIEGLRK